MGAAAFARRLLDGWNLAFREVSNTDRERVLSEWRQVYSAALFRRKGVWVYNGFDWHVFSMHLAAFVEKEAAEDMYTKKAVASYYLLSDIKSYGCYEMIEQRLPTIGEISSQAELRYGISELYIFERSMEWTFMTTHEQDAGFGPFFARRSWQKLHPPGPLAPSKQFGKGRFTRRRHNN